MRRGLARPLETQKRLFGNTALLAGAEAVGQLVNFAFVVGLARVFGRDLLGIYAFAMAIGALSAIVVSHGTHTVLLRELSREPEETTRATGSVLAFQSALALTMALAVHLAARWLAPSPEHLWVVTSVVGFHVSMRLAYLLSIGYQARQEMEAAAVLKAAPRVLILLFAGLAMLWGASAALTLASMPVAALVTVAGMAWVWARRFGHPRPQFRHVEIASYVRQGAPFFLVLVLSTLYARLGIIYLTISSGEAEAGLFASAERLVVAAGTAQVMFSAALLPVVAALWQRGRDGFAELVERAGRLLLFLTLPIATVLALFSDDLIGLIYGDDFEGAAGVLAAAAWLLVVRGVAQLLSTTSVAANRQRPLVLSKALGLGVLTLGSIILVRPYGAPGLVAAMLASELSATTLLYVSLRGHRIPLTRFDGGLRVALACLLAAAAAQQTADLALWLRALAVGGVGTIALWLFGAVHRHDINYLRAILATRGKPGL